MIATLTVLALSGAAQIGDAPDRLITSAGVELSYDGRIFALFAALNGLGYSEESERKGPPLAAPVFHPIRAQVREAMRKLDEEGKLGELRRYFDGNPASIETYAAILLSQDLSLERSLFDLGPDAKRLGAVSEILKTLANDPALGAIFDEALVAQRKHGKELTERLDKLFAAGKKHLAVEELRGGASLVVIPNPLDSHGAVRTVVVGPTTYLLVGPGADTASVAILEAALKNAVLPAVKAAYANAPKLKKAWSDLKPVKSISTRYVDGDVYAAETIAQILSYQIRAGLTPGSSEEEFIDQATKEGYRWTRPLLAALGPRTAEPIDATVTKALARAAL